MTTRNQPHKYRCRTCTNSECRFYVAPAWRIVGDPLYEGIQRGRWEITAEFGCASHSSAIKAEQRIADVIKELEKHRSEININISKTSEEKYIGYSVNEYRRTRIEEIDNALALLRGKEEEWGR